MDFGAKKTKDISKPIQEKILRRKVHERENYKISTGICCRKQLG